MYFMLAAVIAVISILTVFKIHIEQLKQAPENRGQIQTKFFVGVAIAEAIPIILLVLGFMNSAPVEAVNELYFPGLIILLCLVFAPLFVFLQSRVDVSEEARLPIQTFSMLGLALGSSIPLISLVGLFTLAP